MELDIKALKNDLLDALKLPMNELGFKSKGQEFNRRTNEGWERILIVYYEYSYELQVTFSMGIRFEKVEEIYHRTSGFEKKYQKDTSTIGCFIGDYLKKKTIYKIDSHKDTIKVKEYLMDKITSVALDYFSIYDNIKRVDFLLNTDIDKPTVHKGFLPHRAHTGTIVAKLMNNPKCKKITEAYFEQLKTISNGFYLSDYENLLNDIESNW